MYIVLGKVNIPNFVFVFGKNADAAAASTGGLQEFVPIFSISHSKVNYKIYLSHVWVYMYTIYVRMDILHIPVNKSVC